MSLVYNEINRQIVEGEVVRILLSRYSDIEISNSKEKYLICKSLSKFCKSFYLQKNKCCKDCNIEFLYVRPFYTIDLLLNIIEISKDLIKFEEIIFNNYQHMYLIGRKINQKIEVFNTASLLKNLTNDGISVELLDKIRKKINQIRKSNQFFED